MWVKGQLAVSGISLLLLILGIINGSIAPNKDNVTNNDTYWCFETDKAYLCKNDFIKQNTLCVSYFNGLQSCDSGFIPINITQVKQAIKARASDFVTDYNGRDWVCNPNNEGGLGKNSLCYFGNRTSTFGEVQKGV